LRILVTPPLLAGSYEPLFPGNPPFPSTNPVKKARSKTRLFFFFFMTSSATMSGRFCDHTFFTFLFDLSLLLPPFSQAPSFSKKNVGGRSFFLYSCCVICRLFLFRVSGPRILSFGAAPFPKGNSKGSPFPLVLKEAHFFLPRIIHKLLLPPPFSFFSEVQFFHDGASFIASMAWRFFSPPFFSFYQLD